MGCDINYVLEVNVDDKWIGIDSSIGYNTKMCYRNYSLFAELASVRGESSRNRLPLGIPITASELTFFLKEQMKVYTYSHSYIGMNELIEIFIEKNLESEKLFSDYENFGWEKMVDYMFDFLPEFGSINDYRMIFWFDN